MLAEAREPSPVPAAKPAPVAVVIVTWNSAAGIAACLTSVLRETPAEIVVVDNASQDATCDIVRGGFAAVRLIRMAENSGFAAGCNMGAALTSQPYVLFLNDDAVMRPRYLTTLVEALHDNPTAASAVGKLVDVRDGAQLIDSAGIQLDFHALRPVDRGYGELDCGQYDTAGDIFGPSGAAALYRRAALSALRQPGFDPAFFAYYEDVDLAWRLRRQGWRHLYVPQAVTEHRRRGPANKPLRITARAFVNRYAAWLKNESPWRFALYAPLAVPWEAARLLRLGMRSPKTLRAVLRQLVRLRPRELWRARQP